MESSPGQSVSWEIPAKNLRRMVFLCTAMAFSAWIFTISSFGLSCGIITSSIGGVLVLASAGYRPFSFVFVVGLTHLIFYPLAALLNVMLETPAVRPDLWESVELAMAGGAVGCFSLAFGSWLSRKMFRARDIYSEIDIPRIIMLFPIVIQILVAIFLLSLGLYYHSTLRVDYGFENIRFANAITFASWIGHAALLLQLYRYYKTGQTADALLALGGVLFTIALFAPSGNRTLAFQFAPLLALLFLSLEKNVAIKILVGGISVLAGLTLIIGIGMYRDLVAFGILTESGVFASISEVTALSTSALDKMAVLVAHRISDFVATGRIIDCTPSIFPFRGFGDVVDWWQMFLPGSIRPDLALALDGARETVKYGVAMDTEFGSSPVMVIGDLYARGGWVVLVAGMASIGSILGFLDQRILARETSFTILFFVLFGRHVLSLVSSSVLNVFVVMTRELVLMYAIAYILNKGIVFLGDRNVRHGMAK